jgi:hypothetical protein
MGCSVNSRLAGEGKGDAEDRTGVDKRPAGAVPAARPTPAAAPIRRPRPGSAGPRRRCAADPANRRSRPSGVLLAAGDAGGGKENRDTGEHQQWDTGTPHREPAGIIERHRRSEKDSDGGIFGECPQSGTVDRALERRLVLAPTFAPIPARSEALTEVRAAILAMPPELRQVIVLRDVEGRSSDDVRGALNISAVDESAMLHRARGLIRERLERRFERRSS